MTTSIRAPPTCPCSQLDEGVGSGRGRAIRERSRSFRGSGEVVLGESALIVEQFGCPCGRYEQYGGEAICAPRPGWFLYVVLNSSRQGCRHSGARPWSG